MGEKPTVGCIGQGFVGTAYADAIEDRGFTVVRYARSEPHVQNGERIKERDVVLIAVPTPTVPVRSSESEGGQPSTKFDDSVLREVLGLVGEGKVAVIKSTVLPGTTEALQEAFPDIFVLHSPEFLRGLGQRAAEDARHPSRTVIGLPRDTDAYRAHAQTLLGILPKAPIEIVCSAREAELIKYAANSFLATKVVYCNLIHDLAGALGARYEVVRDGIVADPRIGASHTDIVANGGRGAGGPCFIKDFAALRAFYAAVLPEDERGRAVLETLEQKNLELLKGSGKDLDLLRGVYGR